MPLAFGSYNKRIPHPVSSMDWLSRDSVEVARYNEDPLCGFTFTLGGFATLFDLIDRLHDKSRLEKNAEGSACPVHGRNRRPGGGLW